MNQADFSHEFNQYADSERSQWTRALIGGGNRKSRCKVKWKYLSVSVRSNQNIPEHLWRCSTLIGRIKIRCSIFTNRFVACFFSVDFHFCGRLGNNKKLILSVAVVSQFSQRIDILMMSYLNQLLFSWSNLFKSSCGNVLLHNRK